MLLRSFDANDKNSCMYDFVSDNIGFFKIDEVELVDVCDGRNGGENGNTFGAFEVSEKIIKKDKKKNYHFCYSKAMGRYKKKK